jgi:hypothetical protein
MHCKKPLSVAIACVLFMLSGCDRSSESGNYRLNISPSLGMVKNATVRVYADDGRTLVGKGTTGSNGVAGMYIGGYKGPLVISIQGDNDATYFDENLGYEVTFPTGYSMRVLANNSYGNYGVSPLTELAYRIAVDEQLFPLSVYEVNTLNERVRAALAPELDSITRPMTIVDEVLLASLAALPQEERLVDTMGNRYALRLAALADLGVGQERPALAVMSALGSDILDDLDDNDDMVIDELDNIKAGKIDSLDKYGNALATPYNPVTIIDDLNTALNARAGQYAAPDLINAVANYNISLTGGTVMVDLAIADDGTNFTGCVNNGALLVDNDLYPKAVAGRVQNMRFQMVDASAPFGQNQVELFTFCANGQLRLTNSYYPVSNTFEIDIIEEELVDPLDPLSPLTIKSAIYTWRQNSNGMVYELMVLDRILYEVNIYGEKGLLYYGRFVPY